MILQKLHLTQIAANWVEIIRILCTDWAFADSEVNWGYVSMAAFNEMSQRFTFQILISSLPKLICSGNQDEIFNKKTDTELSIDSWFWQVGTMGALPYTLVVLLLFKDEARETRFDIYVLLFVLEEQLLFHLYTLLFFSGQLNDLKSSHQSLCIGPFCKTQVMHRQDGLSSPVTPCSRCSTRSVCCTSRSTHPTGPPSQGVHESLWQPRVGVS